MYAGRVISVYPAAGESVERKSAVTITISTGPAPADIPNVVGQTYENGSAALNNAGFYVDIAYAEDSSAVGTIIAQTPTGSAVQGTTVTITVSTGPAIPETPADTGGNAGGSGGTSGGTTGGDTSGA